MSFFAELKRRNVFKVGVAYAIVSWLIAQVIDVIKDPLHLPDWFGTVVIVLLGIGFLLAIFLAWVYELTPEGIKVTTSEGPAQYHTHATGQRLNFFIIGVLVLAVGFLMVDNYLLVDEPGLSTESSVMEITPDDEVRKESSSQIKTIPSPQVSSSPVRVRRTLINIGPTQSINAISINADIALSRDSSHLVYAIDTEGRHQLYYRALDQLTARPLPDTDNPYSIFLSPDGEWVGYIKENTGLHKVSILGGQPQQLAEQIGWGRGGYWSEDGIMYFINVGKLWKIADTGGEPERVQINSEHMQWFHAWPYGLPGDTHLLLTVGQNVFDANGGQILLLTLETGEVKTLFGNAYNARYVPTGHIVFMRNGSLWAVPFDISRLELTGPAVPVVNNIQTTGGTGNTAYTFSDNGMLVYLPGEDLAADFITGLGLAWVDRQGSETPIEGVEQNIVSVLLSPDEKQLAVGTASPTVDETDVWTYDLERRTMSRRSFTGNGLFTLWTPDGSRLVHGFWPESQGLTMVNADGTGKPEAIIDASRLLIPTSFSPDGSLLIYHDVFTGNPNIYSLSMHGERVESVLLATGFQEQRAVVSPDGRWIAYDSNETGRIEVYVRPFPEVDGGKWQISTNGGMEPRWRADSGELYYRQASGNNENAIIAVTIESEPRFSAGSPVILFSGSYVFPAPPGYDVTADGKRFILLKSGSTEVPGTVSQQTNLVVVENWFEELKRLAPPSQ